MALNTVDDINLHYPKDPKLWEFWQILFWGNAGFMSPAVVALS